MSRQRGGYIGVNRVPAETELNSAAVGVWTLREAEANRRAGTWPTTSDPLFSNVSLLLPFDGSVSDASSVGVTPVAYNNAAANGSAKYGANSLSLGSSYVAGSYDRTASGGTGDYVEISHASALNFGASNFTVEFWYYPIQRSTFSNILGTVGDYPFTIYHGSSINSGNPMAAFGPAGQWFSNASSITLGSVIDNEWTHLAVVRDGDTFRSYRNGIQQGTGTTNSAGQAVGNITTFRIGRNGVHYNKFLLDDLRVTKGVARYIGGTTFTPPSQAFPRT